MPIELPPDEPAVTSWRRAGLDELVGLLLSTPAPERGPRTVAVDGRSASGKTTLAARLREAVPRTAVVHTDDLAWHHSFFDWSDLLREGVLEPARRGEAVAYRPPGWVARGRPGAVSVPVGLDLLVVEGVGAGRREVADLLDAVVWVQADVEQARRRGLERDVASGEHGDADEALAFWHEWEAEEVPFLAAHRPWDRAAVVVLGTPPPGLAGHELLLAPAPSAG